MQLYTDTVEWKSKFLRPLLEDAKMNYTDNFETLVGYWRDPEIKENPNKLTKARQMQLKDILDSFGGDAVPLTHFSDRIMNGKIYVKPKTCSACGHRPNQDKSSHSLKNFEAFPVVYAYLCGVLIRNGHQLELKDGIELGESDIQRNGYIPSELRD